MNPYASYAAPAVDAAGTKHLVWEDNGRLYHSRYDSRAGAWVDKSSITDARGGSNIKLLAGNIIPVDNSGQLYAPGLIAAWQQGIGNDTEVYAVVGRYTETGQLEWSNSVQVTVDGVADTAFDLAVGQNGLMQLVTQKVLNVADPRKSEYREDPEKFTQDLKSPEQGDTDLYHAPLVVERNAATGNLSLVLNPNTSAPNNIGVQKEGAALTFPSVTNIANPIQSGSLSGFLRIPNQTAPTGFQSTGLTALAATNPRPLLGDAPATHETTETPSLPARSGPDYGFQINIGANASNVDGTSFRLFNLKEPAAGATGFVNTILSWFGADLGFDLSGNLGTRVNRDEDDVYSVNAGFELNVTLSKDQKQKGTSSFFVDPGSRSAPSGISIGFGFSGSQYANEKGETTSLERFLRFRASIFKQASLAIPPLPPSLNGYFFQGLLNGKLTFELGRQVVYSELLPGKDPPFTLDTSTAPNLYAISIGAGVLGSALTGGTWAAYKGEVNAGREGLGSASNIFAGLKTILTDVPTAIPILVSGAPIYSPAHDLSNQFKTTQSGVGFGITASITGSGQALLGILDAEASSTMGFNFSFLTEPYTKSTFKFSLGIGLEAGIGPLTWGYDWNFETEATLSDDSPAQNNLLLAENSLPQANSESVPMAPVKLTYNPYRGSTEIHQNSRFNPIGTTQALTDANPNLLSSSPGHQIGSVAVVEGGSGYLGGETGSFLVVPSTGTAVLMAYVEKGTIQQIVVESPGSSYDPNNLPSLDFSQFGGGGTGASANVTLINRKVNDLVNDSSPFLDSINYLVGSSLQTSTALIWVADGADSTKPISETADQLTSRVKVATLSGNFWTIAKEIPGVGKSGMNYDPVLSWYLNGNNQPTLMAVWAHANVDGINSRSVTDSSGTLDRVLDTDLYYTTLDSFAQEWSAPQKLISLPGSDTRLDLRRTSEGSLHLAWVNAEIQPNQESRQTIHSVFFDPRQEIWSQTTTVPITQTGITNSPVASLKVGELEGQPALYWSNSADIPYFASVLNDAPVLYYRLESAGINQSEVNYGSLGTSISSLNFYDGNMTFSQAGALSLDPDPAVKFNGQGAFVATPNSKEDVASDSFSLEAWVKLTDTSANKGIISRGQSNDIQATLPSANLTYKVTQKQDPEGKWFYFVVPDKVELTESGLDIFPNTLQVSNFRINEQLELPFSPQERFTLRAEPDEFITLDQIATGDIIYNIGNSSQTVLFGEDTLIRRRFEVGPGEYDSELIQLTVGQKIKIKGHNYTLADGKTFAVSLQAGDEIAIFDNTPGLGVITTSLAASFDFTPDDSGSLSDIKVNSQQIISSAQGLNYKPFADQEESFSLTTNLEFSQIQDWYLITGEGGKFVFNAGAGEISSDALNLNTWHHVVATYDNITQESKLYINGEIVGQIKGERFTPSNNPILMGYNLNGSLDEVAIYNKSLTVADPNAVQFDPQGKYIIALNPNPPAGEITTHYGARDVDPDSAQEATYSSVWNGQAWSTPEPFVADFKLNPTQASLSRSPAVDLVSDGGLQPDGLPDQHLRVSLAIRNKNLFGRTITGIEIKGAEDQAWGVGKDTQSPTGVNLIGVLLGGTRLNDLKTGQFQHTVLGENEALDLYFQDHTTEPKPTYSVTLTLNNGEKIVLDDLAPSLNLIGAINNSPIVKAEILEKPVAELSEVDSGVVIDIESVGAGQSLVAGKIRNGQIGFAVGHPYELDPDVQQRGLVWVLPAGSNKTLNNLTGIPLKNDDIPADGALIIGKNGDKIGQAMAVGDVDGDGIDDLIIGAPDADEKKGKVYVISGKFLGDGQKIDLALLPANAVITIEGTRLSNAGFSVAVGDVTGDGVADIVIGAPNALNAQGNAVGAVHVVSGKRDFFASNPTLALGDNTLVFAGKHGTSKSQFDLLSTPNDKWHSQVGYSVAVVQPGSISNPKAHNINGQNATAHILIGAPGYHQTIRFDVNGKPLGISQEQLDQYKTLLSHTPNSGIGSVPSQKDINTGRAYLVYGGQTLLTQDTLTDDNLSGKGIIFDGSPLEDRDMRLGEVVTGAGDMNGDGYVDIALSAPEAAGRAGLTFIFGGRGGDLKDKYSVMTESDVLIAGGDLFNYAGQSLAGIGDVNNDGIDDLLIGAPQAGSGKGQSFVIFGVEGFKLSQGDFPKTISLKPGIPDDSFVLNGGKVQGLAGQAIAKGFDLNGDNVGDMLLSAPFAKQVYVAFGHPWLKKEGSVRLDNLANDQGIIINRYVGSEPKYKFEGKFVSNLGDINGDGYADMAVAGNGESALIQFGGATWDLLDAGFGSGQLPIFLKKDTVTDITIESIQGIGDINNDGFSDVIVYNSRSKIQDVNDFSIVLGGDNLKNQENLTLDVTVGPGEEPRQRQYLTPPGFALGQPNSDVYKQSLGLGESIYAPVLTLSEHWQELDQQNRRIQPHLTLESNGELKFYDYRGNVVWTGGKADAGIVKMEIGLLDGKYRILFKDKDNNIVSSSSESVNYVEGKVPYLRVGYDFITLSQRDNNNKRGNFDPSMPPWLGINGQRQDIILYSPRDKFDDAYDVYNSTSTVWGNALPSLIGGENFTSPDGERSFGLMPVSAFSEGSPHGFEPSIIGILERDDTSIFLTKSIWSPASTSLEFTNPTDVYLRFRDNGDLVVDFNNTDYKIWSSNTFGNDLSLSLNKNLTSLNIVQDASAPNQSGRFIGFANLYGHNLGENLNQFTPAGDLNNDGYPDLVTFDVDKVYFRYGSASGNITQKPREFNAPGFGVTAGVGDINGDGDDDLFSFTRNGTFISTNFDTFVTDIKLRQPVTIPGLSRNVDYFDNAPSIFTAGDLNGDGIADFVVRDTYILNNTTRQALRLVYGNPEGTTFQSSQIQTNSSIRDELLSVSGVGDINGDGFDDLIFASPSDNNNTGKIYLLFGGLHLNPKYPSFKPIFTPGELGNLSGNEGFTITGLPNSRAGESVSGGEDINGDGLSDFMIGTPGDDGSLGLTYALFGGDFTKSIHQAGTQGNDILEGTGTGDLLLGLPGDDTLKGNGGRDVLYGGGGDDELIVADPHFLRVDGGSGFNTLSLQGYKDQDWDLTTLAPGLRIKNISAVDLSKYGQNTLTLNQITVNKITNMQNNLVVLGDADDQVILDAAFKRTDSFNFAGTLYDRYQAGTANVLVLPSIKAAVQFTANPVNVPIPLPSVNLANPQTTSPLLGSSAAPLTSVTSNGQPTQFYVAANPTPKEAGVFTFTVSRSGDLSKSVTAIYQTINDTAIAGRDYVASLGTLVFAPGELSKIVEVPLIDTATYGGNNRSFGLAIQPVNQALGVEFGSQSLHLQTESASQLRNLDKGSLAPITALSLQSAFPLGAMNFNVTAPGGKTIITVPFNGVIDLNSFFRLNATTEKYEEFWYNGKTGVEFVDSKNDGRTDTLRIHLVDGGRGDADGVANGVIVGSNAPAMKTPGPVQVNPGIFLIPTQADGQLQFHSLTVPGKFELGVFTVDDPTGSINGLKSTDAGYAEAALARKQVILDNPVGSYLNALTSAAAKQALSNPELLVQNEFAANGSFIQAQLAGGKLYGLYLTQNGQTNFSINNQDLQITDAGRGYHDLAWDGAQVEVGTSLLITPGNVDQTYQANIQLARGGAYNNTIALFQVDSLTGEFDLDNDGVMDLRPGDADYRKTVLERIQDPLTGVALPRVETIFGKTNTAINLSGGQMYGLALISNATVGEFLSQNPNNVEGGTVHSFFSFDQANPNGVSHVRRLGENLWGFEDILGGGDRDFNDMVLQIDFAAPSN